MKFAHLADTHIKNLKYHTEYKEIFSQLYEKLREEKVDCIIHCGDMAHTKTQISPEFVDLCASFLGNLADIAPTYLILGNHDGNLKNSSRQDALSPIVEALKHPQLHLLKNSGETPLTGHKSFELISDVIGTNYVLNVLSVFDRENWTRPSDPEKINIALYHGSIHNCKTDLDWVMENGEDSMDIFEGFDYAMLGDIHRGQAMDPDGRVRYCGSTVQQNHGETDDKGFLLWDVKSKEDFTVEHITLKNPKPFITVELTPKGRIPKGFKVPENARIRLVSNNNLPLNAVRKAADIAKKRFSPESVTFLNRAAGERGTVGDLSTNFFKEDLRDLAVQKEFIEEYLKDYQADEGVLNRVYELNKKFNTTIEKEEDIARNINWRLESLEWDNLFNYGEDNSIDFEKLTGIVGIFGKNFSGKSSIVDSLLYTIFNSTSKNTRKNLNVINQEKQSGKGRVKIRINDNVYTIERTSDKYMKKLKGEETLEAKTDLDFFLSDELGNHESKNGLSRIDTDKNIRKIFGSLDDFLFTSMSSQHGALSFINEGSTRRKEILAKFLDLELFEKKYRLAKDEASEIKVSLNRLSDRKFEEELEGAVEQLESNECLTKEKKGECESIHEDIEKLKEDINAIDVKLHTMPSEIVDIAQIKLSLKEKEDKNVRLSTENEIIRNDCREKRELYDKILKFVDSFDIESYKKRQSEVETLTGKVEQNRSSIELMRERLTRGEKKIELLSEVPCSEEYSHCKFIKDAYSSKREVPGILREVEKSKTTDKQLRTDLEQYNPQKISEHITKFDLVLKRRDEVANSIAQCELQIEKNQNQIITLRNGIKELSSKETAYEENKEVIENCSVLKEEKTSILSKINRLAKKAESCETLLQQLYISHGSFMERIENIKNQQNEAQNLRNQYEAYDLFMRCTHPNGISYDIIKNKLPAINEEIAKILTNIVDFEAFFEEEGNRLNIYIKHPKYDPRPIEMGSGAEKSIAAMAIRLALINVSNLPKGNIFVLDEPATDLDEENMDGFVRTLEMIKSYFKTVLLISHLDSLKDCVDKQLVIDKRDGYAFVDC